MGTELLLGDILNTDAQFLSQELAKLGFGVLHQSVVGDNHDRLLSALGQAAERSDIIILSGGLGPTPDDLTKEVACEFFGKELVLQKGTARIIADICSVELWNNEFYTVIGHVMKNEEIKHVSGANASNVRISRLSDIHK